MKSKAEADKRAEILSTPIVRVAPIPREDFVSTGCTQLNLAFSGKPNEGIPKGTYLYLIGDSGAMKTWLTWSILAEAANNKHFDDYDLIYDSPENGSLLELPKFFGQKLTDRIKPLRGTRAKPETPDTVEQFYFFLDDALKRPCIIVEDSMDALTSDDDDDKFQEQKRAYENNKKTTGTYGMGKAKANSRNISRIVQKLRRTGSILIIISQTRDKVGGTIPGLKTRSGGKSLKFYAHLEVWTSIRGIIERRYLGKDREIGATIRCDVQKNRVCGWEGCTEIPFIKGYGIDDLGGMIDYLVEEQHWELDGDKKDWKSTDYKLVAPEFEFKGRREVLAKTIENDKEEWKLQKLVAQVWNEIVEGARPDRNPRYT